MLRALRMDDLGPAGRGVGQPPASPPHPRPCPLSLAWPPLGSIDWPEKVGSGRDWAGPECDSRSPTRIPAAEPRRSTSTSHLASDRPLPAPLCGRARAASAVKVLRQAGSPCPVSPAPALPVQGLDRQRDTLPSAPPRPEDPHSPARRCSSSLDLALGLGYVLPRLLQVHGREVARDVFFPATGSA